MQQPAKCNYKRGKTYKGSVLEQQLVTLVCYPYLAPPANHGLAGQTRPLGCGVLVPVNHSWSSHSGHPISSPEGRTSARSHTFYAGAVPRLPMMAAYFAALGGLRLFVTLSSLFAWLSPTLTSSILFSLSLILSSSLLTLHKPLSSTFRISVTQSGCYHKNLNILGEEC